MMCITADVAVGTNRIKRDIEAMFAELSKVHGLGLGIVK
jgi:hypothetical protein